MDSNIHLRLAVPEDVPVLRELINALGTRVCRPKTTPRRRSKARSKTVFGVDSQLIADGTYIVAEAEENTIAHTQGIANAPITKEDRRMRRLEQNARPFYGSDHWTGREDFAAGPCSRCGKRFEPSLSSPIGRAAESASPDPLPKGPAKTPQEPPGFLRYEMGATLTGARLFGAKGYVAVKPISIPLINGESLPVIHMEKQA